MILSYEQLKTKINDAHKLYIYGAGIVAYGASEAIRLLCKKNIDAFVVSDSAENGKSLAGITINQVDRNMFYEKTVFVLVATPEEYHQQIAETLESNGCGDYAFLTSHLEYCLMGEFLQKSEGIQCIEDCIIRNVPEKQLDARVYMALSHNDRKLAQIYEDETFVEKIQVGAALTDIELEGVKQKDNTGANISEENPLYGELTATYWAWKNDLHDIMGLFHYRRVLNVAKEQLAMLNTDAADVILPLPFVCYPDTSGQYGRYISAEDMQIALDVLKESYPEQHGAVEEMLKGKYLYNYNMLIAKREVYADYCAWMFPMLEEIARRCESISRTRLPRYIGRIGEILTSAYFMVNKKNWKIIHAEKVWRV